MRFPHAVARTFAGILAIVCLGSMVACDDPLIGDRTDEFGLDIPCGAADAGSCTWNDDVCEFTAAELNFCGQLQSPPACFAGDEELVASVVATVPPILTEGPELTCTLTDGANPATPANATVCAFPLDDDTCSTPWQFFSETWDANREVQVCESGAGAQCTLQSSAGVRIVVVDLDESVCDSLTIRCVAR